MFVIFVEKINSRVNTAMPLKIYIITKAGKYNEKEQKTDKMKRRK